MIDITKIIEGFTEEEGIWYKGKVDDVSYVAEGNKLCFQIEEDSFWFRHRNDVIKAVLNNFPPQGMLFDIGGGNGFVTKRMEELAYPAVLIEPGKDGVQNARARGVKHIINATLNETDFKPGSIDNACIFDVLEHIEHPGRFLKTLHKLMKDEGMLYITVPAYGFLWSDEDVIAGHYTRYTENRLKKALTEAGFEVEFSSYFFSVLIFPILLLRSIPSLFKKKKHAKNDAPSMSDHNDNNGFISNILKKIWHWEYNRINSNKSISIGSSIIMVCKK